MKKLIALMMVLAIIASFAACGTEKKETEDTTTTTTENVTEDTTPDTTEKVTTDTDNELVIGEDTAALEIMEYAWVALGGERQPAVIGGHFSAEYTTGPYTYELTYAEDLAATLLLPEDQMDKVTDAATAVHMLNANSMTAGVIKLAEGTDVKAFADAVADRIVNNQWMCGFPEKMAIIQINEDYLFITYGLYELIDPMVEGLSSDWTMNELYNRSLMEETTEEIVE